MESRRASIVGVAAFLTLVGAACGRDAGVVTETRVGAVTGTIAITGAITDANGLPLAGVKVNLDGTSQAVQTTGSSGSYSFSSLKAGSYSVRPTLNNCSFVPDVVNLNNLTTNAVQNFGGSGSRCGGNASVNTGATTGAFTISGQVRDAGNHAIVGAKLSLAGSVQALRFTDVTGSYTFHVGKGNYSLAASGACSLTPANVNFNNLASNQVQNFTATTAGCITSTISGVHQDGAVFTLASGGAVLGATGAAIEPRSSNANAVSRLQEIASESTASVQSLTIAGLPAIERQAVLDKRVDRTKLGPRLWLTTAIATGSSVVRFDSQLDPGASAQTIAAFFAAGRNFTTDEMPGLHGPPRATIPAAPRVPPAHHPALPTPLFASSLANTFGEIAVAASDSSNAVVYARNPGLAPDSRVSYSADGGGLIVSSVLSLNAASASFSSLGDPGLTVGAPNTTDATQAFYYLEIFQSGGTADDPLGALVTFRSTDGGATFQQTNASALDCNVDGTCQIPDQPMIAGDKLSQTSQGDRLYVAWRHATATSVVVGVACSSNGGDSWSAKDITTIPAGGDFPRVAVGPDGTFYVAYETGQGNGSYGLWVQKYSRCDDGFKRQPNFPVKIKDGIKEIAAIPGPDRPQSLGPYMVAADDSDSTGQRVFVAYIEEVSLDSGKAVGNDNLRVAESTKGGTSWTIDPFPLNTVPTGHRFSPWLCATNGIVYATWYDRRDASTTNSDPTAYFQTSFSDTTSSGTPVMGTEVNVSGGPSFDDPQCTSGFYTNLGSLAAVWLSGEETLCTDLPALPTEVLAGACTSCPDKAGLTVCGSGTPCDLRAGATPCPSGETCSPQKGIPKYGDYNGAACAGGQLFMSWASAVAPQGINCAVAGAPCTTLGDCCAGTRCLGGFCSSFGSSCLGNGTACTNSSSCCSFNCLGGTCEASVSIFSSSTAVTTNTTCTTATPDESVSAPFEFDTGLPPSTVGSSYGTPACPDQFLVDIDLTQSGFAGQSVFVAGRWSAALPATPCDEQATMTVFVTADGTNWKTHDIVPYVGQMEGSVCHAVAQSHTDQNSVGLGGTIIPASGFLRARVAVSASEGGSLVPALVSGDTN